MVCLESGQTIGVISELLVDVEPKKVAFIVLQMHHPEVGGFEMHLFRYTDLTGVGDVAVTIQSEKVVRTISSEVLFQQVFADQISIRNSKVISHVGNDLGVLTDFIFNTDSAAIEGLQIEDNGQVQYYGAEPYLLLSAKCLVLNPDQQLDRTAYEALDVKSFTTKVNLDKEQGQDEDASVEPGSALSQTEAEFNEFPDMQEGYQVSLDPAPHSAGTAQDFGIPTSAGAPQGLGQQGVPMGGQPMNAYMQGRSQAGVNQGAQGYGANSVMGNAQMPYGQNYQQPSQMGGAGMNPQRGQAPFQTNPSPSFEQGMSQEQATPAAPQQQRRAGGLFFRRNQPKKAAAQPSGPAFAPPQPMSPAEETMSDQDILNAMKNFMDQ